MSQFLRGMKENDNQKVNSNISCFSSRVINDNNSKKNVVKRRIMSKNLMRLEGN